MKKEITIAIVDDELLFRKSISHILNREENIRVVFEGGDGQEIIQYLKSGKEHPDIILMDIRMPVLDGVEASKIILRQFPNIKIIVLSSITSERFVEILIRYGASAYLMKNADPKQVVHTIEQVSEKGLFFDTNVTKIMINSQNSKRPIASHKLSKREMEILQLMCKQLNTKEIADHLCISERTVEGHRLNMLEKTDSKNSIGLILWGIKNEVLMIG
jgi:DNA-binding NarL/FixJ family response regulator